MVVLTIDWRQVLEVCLYVISFLSFCLAGGLYALKKRWLPEKFLYIGSLVFGLAFNYLLFFLYARSFRLGHLTSIIFTFGGLLLVPIVINWLRNQKKLIPIVSKYFFLPLFVIGLLTIAYGYLFYGCNGNSYAIDQWGEIQNPAFCHVAKLPIDNALPFIYGENVLKDRASTLVIDWSIADRPPLQIGAALPILDFTQGSVVHIRYGLYTLLSIFLQLSWVGVMWGILHTLFKKRLHIWGSLIALSTTGFLYLNSVFVWPKLLAASLFVFAVCLLLFTEKKEKTLLSYRYLPMAAAAAALSLLSHTGVLFTLFAVIPLVLYDVRKHSLLKPAWLKRVGIAALLAVVLLLPWQIAKSQLITHDRLVKWHFAGVVPAEDPRGTLETIVQEYKKLPLNTWVANKKANFEILVTGGVHATCSSALSDTFDDCNMSAWRDRVFFSSFYSLEWFAAGFLVLIWQAFKRTLDKLDKELLLIFGSYLVIWSLLMFLPGSTVLHQGSYASMLLLLVLLIKKLALLPDYLFVTFVGLQVSIFALAWLRPFGFL